MINKEKAKGLLEEQKSNIDIAFDKLSKIQDKVKKRWKRWIDWPFRLLDEQTQWMIEWKVYTIWAFSNTWKSQLSYEYVSYFLKKWKKVLFVSTEVWSWDLLAFIWRNYYKVNYQDILFDKYKLKKEDFKNLSLFDDTHNFERISKLVDEYKPDILVIDFIQSIDHIWTSEYEKMSKIATDLQELTIRKDLITISLSQVNNDSRNKDWVNITLKWSWWLFASSDVIFWLYRDNWEIKLAITKNKFWPYNKIFNVIMNFETWDIKMAKSLDCNEI